MIEVACLFYDICGAKTTFVDEADYEVFGDDWVCPECSEQMNDLGVSL